MWPRGSREWHSWQQISNFQPHGPIVHPARDLNLAALVPFLSMDQKSDKLTSWYGKISHDFQDFIQVVSRISSINSSSLLGLYEFELARHRVHRIYPSVERESHGRNNHGDTRENLIITPEEKEIPFGNHHFFGSMLVFRGVIKHVSWLTGRQGFHVFSNLQWRCFMIRDECPVVRIIMPSEATVFF